MTFDSVYEMFTPLVTERKQHFWDFFHGDSVRNYWLIDNVVGTGSIGMQDTVREGATLKSGSTNGNASDIDFGDTVGPKNYDWDGSVFITVARRDNTVSRMRCGF